MLVTTTAILVAYLLTFAINRQTAIPGLKKFFDLGQKQNPPTWWNVILLALIAVAAIVASWFEPADGRGRRQAWWVIAAGPHT